jgi:hypothetical protein
LIGKGTPLDELLGSEEAVTRFFGVELTAPLRKWALETLAMLRDERNRQWPYLVRRQQFLDASAKRRNLISGWAAELRTTEEAIEEALKYSPEWQEKFEIELKKVILRKKNFRRYPAKVPKVTPKQA